MRIKFSEVLFYIISALFLNTNAFCQTLQVEVVAGKNGTFKNIVSKNGLVNEMFLTLV